MNGRATPLVIMTETSRRDPGKRQADDERDLLLGRSGKPNRHATYVHDLKSHVAASETFASYVYLCLI